MIEYLLTYQDLLVEGVEMTTIDAYLFVFVLPLNAIYLSTKT